MLIVNKIGGKIDIPEKLKDNFIGKGWEEVKPKKQKDKDT